MAKKVDGFIKLQIKAGQASPAPPIGPALGQKGVNIMEFCKAFNAATQDRMGLLLPVVITVYADKSFTFIVKSPPASTLLLKAAKIESGSENSRKIKVAQVTWEQCREIAQQKMEDLNAFDLDQGAMMIAGTARSMGIIVQGKPGATAAEMAQTITTFTAEEEAARQAAKAGASGGGDAEGGAEEAAPEEAAAE